MGPHGNIALPLKILGGVIGVITLKTRPDIEVNEETVRLLCTLGNQISIAVNNAKLYDEARNFSLRDHLTGLANRRFLNMQLEKSVKAARRYREKLSVIMLDIDHFKQFNDTYGHVQGDRLLVKIAGILMEEMRSSDYVFRYGGEEFLVILSQTDLMTACDAAERLRTSVESSTAVTISLGVSTYRETMQDDEDLIRTADTALYQAKQRGRNRVVASP
jgi:diguanylate cyclase (GGDEF)-like protein